MEDQNVQTWDENTLVDMFSGQGVQSSQKEGVKFGTEEVDLDLFSKVPDKPEEIVDPNKGAEDPNKQPEAVDPNKATDPEKEKVDLEDPNKQVDILDDSKKPGRKPKYDFSDMSGYYQDRVKNKKFVAIQEEDAEGNKVLFVPKTPEEFDEVIDLQVNHRLAEERKALEQKVFEGKSPAWKAAIQFAGMVDDPSQMIPFLQGVKNIQSVANLNPEELDGAEQIVRARLEQRGDPQEVIETQIESLKTTDKLISTAKQYKPVILQQEQQFLAQQVQEEKQREQEYIQIVTNIRENAVKAIEQPIFGKTKLKQEEKAAIYDLIAEPSSDTQGYGIYTAIDQLFDKGDFETLRQVALLLSKKDSFFNYVNAQAANSTAASLQKKLSVAAESRNSSGKDFVNLDPDQPVVQRNQYTKQVRFGMDK